MYIQFPQSSPKFKSLNMRYQVTIILDDFERFDEKVKVHLKCSMLLRVLCCCTVK